MDKLYTINEVCKILKVTRTSIDRWRADGKINVIQINGVLRVTQTELDRLMKGE